MVFESKVDALDSDRFELNIIAVIKKRISIKILEALKEGRYFDFFA
jgi:hypothetical protein